MNSAPRALLPSLRTTPLAPARPSTVPSTVHMGWPSTSLTRGTRSTHSAGALDVHRSWGSVRWVSTSMILRPVRADAGAMASPLEPHIHDQRYPVVGVLEVL